ncbi:MAG: DUF58 domain-containing protein, partial [Kineosporiaceae bacterium]
MVLTWRAVAVAVAGVAPVALAPGWVTLLAWLGVLGAVLVLDVALAASPRALTFTRAVPPSVRLGEPVDAVLTV